MDMNNSSQRGVGLAALGGCNEPPRALHTVTGSLDNRVDQLTQELHRLYDRIEPLMVKSGGALTPVKQPAAPIASSAVVTRLAEIEDRLQYLVDGVRSAIDRLEV